jgi:hypothetical protein
MRSTLAFVLLLTAFSAPTLGQDAIIPGTPPGWLFGGDYEKYDVGTAVLPRMKPGTQTAYIKAGPNAECGAYGALFQTISAEQYRGKLLQFSARLFEEGLRGGDFNMFIFVSGPSGDGTVIRARWDTMTKRVADGGSNFRNEALNINVPANAQEITFGFRLTGPGGTGWVDAVRLEAMGEARAGLNHFTSAVLPPEKAARMPRTGFLGWQCAIRRTWLAERGLYDRDERSLVTLARRSAPQGVQVALSAK